MSVDPTAKVGEAQEQRNLELAEIQELVHRLAPLDRQIILLYLEGGTAAEIGDVTGLSARNCATRIYPQDLWKRDDPALPQPPATTETCALARRRERENIWMRRIALFALAAFASAFARNAWSIDQPWVRFSQGWMLIVMTVYLWSLIRDHTGRRASNETCTGFLLRALEKKRDGFLVVRRVVLLIIPAILASCAFGAAAKKSSVEFEALRQDVEAI